MNSKYEEYTEKTFSDLYEDKFKSDFQYINTITPIIKADKWDSRFLDMADLYASWSKDPSSQVGCVIVEPSTRRVLSGGYNGFPRKIYDDPNILNDREKKYKLTIHAEKNAIYNATQSGIRLNGATLYCSGLPSCSDCALAIIQVGIERVVCRWPARINVQEWLDKWEESKKLFHKAKIYTKEM